MLLVRFRIKPGRDEMCCGTPVAPTGHEARSGTCIERAINSNVVHLVMASGKRQQRSSNGVKPKENQPWWMMPFSSRAWPRWTPSSGFPVSPISISQDTNSLRTHKENNALIIYAHNKKDNHKILELENINSYGKFSSHMENMRISAESFDSFLGNQ